MGILTLRLTQSNQWVGVDHAARIHYIYIYICIYTFHIAFCFNTVIVL